MLEVKESQGSKTLNAALARVRRFPLPIANVAKLLCDGRGYEDDPYVDCPYDDYQDYNDSRTEDD